MKKLISVAFAFFMCTFSSIAQVPEGFKYQTIVRDEEGKVISNQVVTIKIDIVFGDQLTLVVCSETFQQETNEFGLVNLLIGSQDPESFEAIDWSTGPYYLKISLNGEDIGTSPLLSVPYALYAKNSGSAELWMQQGDNIYYSQGSVGIGSGLINNSAVLDVTSSTKGFLPPRMTYNEIQQIQAPANGLVVFCTDCEDDGLGALSLFMYGKWFKLATDCLPPPVPVTGIHDATQTQITWRWHPVSTSASYKWNTINDISTSQELGTDTFLVETGLNCDTEYIRYVWAYDNDCNSTSLQLNQVTAECAEPGPCPGMPTVEYEGITYNTILIGAQCWLKENLNLGTQINGVSNPSDNGIVEKYCYDDLTSNCELYGGLYQFNEMMEYNTEPGSRGICPEGWHIPTDEEWCTLSLFVDDEVICNTIYFSGIDAGFKMKASSGWIENGNGSNESGFTALPGGVRYTSYYDGIGWASDIWTSTMTTTPGAYYRVFGSNQDGIGRYNSALSSHHGFAVRCLRDE